ncbi:MAG: zinc metalloprotease HtpX [Phycisphaeraceae bacterium]
MTRFVNNVKTAILLGGLFGLILAVSSIWGPRALIVGFLFGGMINMVAYFYSDKIALASMRGQLVDARTAPDLVHMVERLARNAGLPMPRVYICPQQAPNAFATGRNPSKAAVAVTRGALQLLTYDELEGVMAHELAHVKNRDTLISCVAATIAGALSSLAWMMMWFGGGRSRDGGNPLMALLLIIFAPIAAMLIQMAISRSREFVADADGAHIAGTPFGLMGALQKLDATARRVPLAHENPAQNHMFIVQPLTGRGLSKLFSTHPATAERVRRLRELG